MHCNLSINAHHRGASLVCNRYVILRLRLDGDVVYRYQGVGASCGLELEGDRVRVFPWDEAVYRACDRPEPFYMGDPDGVFLKWCLGVDRADQPGAMLVALNSAGRCYSSGALLWVTGGRVYTVPRVNPRLGFQLDSDGALVIQ